MKNLIYLILLGLCFSCGGIKTYKCNDLKKMNDVSVIEGVYENMPQDSAKFYHRSFNGNINWRKKTKDTTSFETFEISILNKKRLKIDFFKSDSLIKNRVLKYRLRNNGFIKLRNNNFRIFGIPYVFGDYEMNKYQLGLTKDNNLILHGYTEEAGGLLIVLSGGHAFDVKYIYESVQ